MAETNTVVTGKQFSLNVRDLLRGLLLAVSGAVVAVIYGTVSAGSLNFDWELVKVAAISGGCSYLIKNFFTPTEIVLQNPSKSEVTAVEAGRATVEVTKTPV